MISKNYYLKECTKKFERNSNYNIVNMKKKLKKMIKEILTADFVLFYTMCFISAWHRIYRNHE